MGSSHLEVLQAVIENVVLKKTRLCSLCRANLVKFYYFIENPEEGTQCFEI